LTELGKEIEKERINSDLDWLKGATDKELWKARTTRKKLNQLSQYELNRIIHHIEHIRIKSRGNKPEENFSNDDDTEGFVAAVKEYDNEFDLNNRDGPGKEDDYVRFGYVTDKDRVNEDMF
jgi:hypothetical protein